MEYLEAKVNQLIIETSGKNKTFVRSFATKPTKNLANKLGKIFGVIEIEASNPKIPNLIDLIIEEIKNNYYYSQDREGEDSFANISSHFEIALKKTNLAIASFLEAQQISFDLDKIAIIIGLNHHQEVHFTLVGRMEAVIFYNLAKNNYRIVDILEAAQVPIVTPDPLKLFSQIFSGKIRPHDILLLNTPNLLDYFSLEKIKNIITESTATEGLNQIKNLLAEPQKKENFALLTLELEKITVPVEKPIAETKSSYQYNGSNDSIQELIKTERETEKLLTPSLMPELKKYFGQLFSLVKNNTGNLFGGFSSKLSGAYNKQKKYFKKPHIKLPIHPKINLPHPKINLPSVSAEKLKAVAKNVSRPVLIINKKIVSDIARQPIWHKAKDLFKKLFGHYLNRYRQLPKSSQVLLIISIILFLLFGQSVAWLAYKGSREKKIEAVNKIIFDVENKKNEAESSLIYRSENQARQLLMESKELLTGITPILKTQTEQITNLNQQIENKLVELRHLIEITEPIQIANLQNLDTQAKISNVAILNQRNVYIQDQNNKSVYKINLDSRIVSALLPNDQTGNFNFGAWVSNNELLFMNESKNLWQLNPGNDQLTKANIGLPTDNQIIDLISYNNRIYLLDRGKNQIYRYSKTGNDWGGKTDWLKENLNLSEAKSFTIDGAIYILQSNGQIIKIENGKKIDFTQATIEPALQAPTKIKTNDNSKYLYILDPPTKRLVVIDKNGALISQYSSASFNDLKDFVVIEQDHKAYLLSGSSIFGVPLDYLK